MSASSRDWEHWTAPLPPDDWGSSCSTTCSTAPDDGEVDLDTVDQDTASIMFEEMLVGLKLSGELPAKQVCVLAFWALKGGLKATEVLRGIATKPTAQTGAFSRNFDNVFGTSPKEACLYQVDTAMKVRCDASRAFKSIPTAPMHEALADEFVTSDSLTVELRHAIEDNDLPDIYWNHPVVQQASLGEWIFPVMMYLDAVAFGRGNSDSVIGWWAYFMLSRRRHLLAVFRRTDLCSCGCRGWCSLHPIWESLAWAVRALHAGRYPSIRHDLKPWLPSDKSREPLAGEALPFKGYLNVRCGGWCERSRSLISYLPSIGSGPRWARNAFPGPRGRPDSKNTPPK